MHKIPNFIKKSFDFFQIYFHRRQLRHGQEGVELGSDAEVKWTAHLLQISDEYLHKVLTTRVTETRAERLYTPLGIDQALDARDAFAKVLYSGLFNWYVFIFFMICAKILKKIFFQVGVPYKLNRSQRWYP